MYRFSCRCSTCMSEIGSVRISTSHQVQTRSAGYFGGLDLERIHFLWLSATGQGLLNRTKVRLNREGRKGNYQTIFIMGDFNRCIKNEGYQK